MLTRNWVSYPLDMSAQVNLSKVIWQPILWPNQQISSPLFIALAFWKGLEDCNTDFSNESSDSGWKKSGELQSHPIPLEFIFMRLKCIQQALITTWVRFTKFAGVHVARHCVDWCSFFTRSDTARLGGLDARLCHAFLDNSCHLSALEINGSWQTDIQICGFEYLLQMQATLTKDCLTCITSPRQFQVLMNAIQKPCWLVWLTVCLLPSCVVKY